MLIDTISPQLAIPKACQWEVISLARKVTKRQRSWYSTLKDPDGANLDRIQIVKGWLDGDGELHEKVYDVVWAGDREPGQDGKLPAVGNTVDLETATYSNSIGVVQLSATWRDPKFDPTEKAFYYTRVLEIPTPRWNCF